MKSTLVPDKWVIPIIHPATVIPPKNVFLNKHLIINDLLKAARICEKESYEPYSYEVITRPSFFQIMEFLNDIEEGKTITAFDIEVSNEEVSCISFSVERRVSMSIAFVDDQGDIFTIEQELEIWLKIAKILEDSSIRKLGQNLAFDAHFLLRRYGIKVRPIHDTMVAQQIIMPDYPKGLDFITSIHTDLPYYKDEGKRWFKVGGSWGQLWHYNGLDSLTPSISFPKQLKELQNQGNIDTYNRQRAIIEPLVYIMEHGTNVDIEGIKNLYESLMKEVEELQDKLNQLAGGELNPNSPAQLKNYFYVKKGLKPYKKRGTGSIAVDNDALKRLARKGMKEAKLIQRIRKNKKLASTYLNSDKIDPDNRIRCSYNPVGTRYSRISSSSNIFGTGMNMQNWPHAMLKFLMADDGYVGYAFDLSQAENRIVAYVGNVQAMIDAFEHEKDVHSLTASLIFQKPITEITTEDNTCDLGDGTHSERFWGKKANHGLNYDLGYRTFSFYYEIPEREGKFIVSRYHLAYPGVRNVFHKKIRDQLFTSRVVTNLMGRKTPFLGRLDDATFKESYACIPQGTVGDVINERGMNYIYYNPEKFEPIELLGQVHDEIIFQIPLSVPWEEHARMINDIRSKLEIPLKTNGREFVIPADLTIFKRFKKGTELKGKKFSRDLKVLSEQLASAWNEHKDD